MALLRISRTTIPYVNYFGLHVSLSSGQCTFRARKWSRCLHSSHTFSQAKPLDDISKKTSDIESRQALATKKKETKKLAKLEKQKEILDRIKLKESKLQKTLSVYQGSTVPGEKKDTSIPLPETYSPGYVEAAWYDWWVRERFFTPEYSLNNQKAEPNSKEDGIFTLCLPPPNVTGTLHLGHALGNSIQDAVVRWHRMHGVVTLWNPGSDHAGISTQVVVEKRLWRDTGKSRHDLGREKFIEEVWKWKNEKGGEILEQMRRLGSSLDWSRDCFTLDPKLSRAVNEAFIRLFDSGEIYRSRRLVNWSCSLKSAISDIEVDSVAVEGKTYLEVPGYDKKIPFGVLYTFSYPVIDSDEHISVSTTRPETLLGDVGVAVHPQDSRYSHLHNRSALNPLTQRVMPIVCSDDVDKNFGTGAVKLTPSHDQMDYSIAQAHDLPLCNVISEDGRLINVPQPYLNMKRFEARAVILESLKTLGLFEGSQDHSMVIPRCSRSGDVVEYLMKDQWYVKCADMADKASQAVNSGRLKLIPNSYEKTWHEWMNNCSDWCISRQLWWGHRVPVYIITSSSSSHKLDDDGNVELWVAAHSESEALNKASVRLTVPVHQLQAQQDEDVLDTWFSSSLFPFSIFGWPDQTEDLSRFYPTSLLETASDIMFFWVARMIMLGERLTGALPFNQVLFHSILRDSHGRKMSKSLGNVVDPMDVIQGISLEDLQSKLLQSNLDKSEISKASEGQKRSFPLGIPECGADALRFTLCSYNFFSQHINVDVSHIKSTRHFCNKIWQATRYVLSSLGSDDFKPSSNLPTITEQLSSTDRWMLSRLSHTVRQCNELFSEYKLNEITRCLHSYWLHDFCDIYLEFSKPVLKGGTGGEREAVREVLYWSCEGGLRLLAPFMPFLCEELYQRLPATTHKSVCIAQYPTQQSLYNESLDVEMTHIREISSCLNSLRKDLNLTKTRANVYIAAHSDTVRQSVTNHTLALQTISRSASIALLDNTLTLDQSSAVIGCLPVSVNSDWTAYVQLEGLVDRSKEMARLGTELNKLQTEQNKQQQQFNQCNTPERRVIEEEKLKNLEANKTRIQKILETLQTIKHS